MIALLASAAIFATSKFRASGGTENYSLDAMPLRSRFAIAFVACWTCSLPHAYMAVPHYKTALPLRVAGLEAYATGNALAAFLVCAIILLLTQRKPKDGLIVALIAAVLVNAGLIYEYVSMSHPIR